jgi:hypothetical protein
MLSTIFIGEEVALGNSLQGDFLSTMLCTYCHYMDKMCGKSFVAHLHFWVNISGFDDLLSVRFTFNIFSRILCPFWYEKACGCKSASGKG